MVVVAIVIVVAVVVVVVVVAVVVVKKRVELTVVMLDLCVLLILNGMPGVKYTLQSLHYCYQVPGSGF